MASSSVPRWLPIALGAAVTFAVFGWLLRARPSSDQAQAATESTEPSDRATAPRARRTRGPVAARERDDVETPEKADEAQLDAPAPRPGDGPVPQPGKRRAFLDTSDPCEPIAEVGIPASYQRQTEANVTVAWPSDLVVLEPTALAFAIAGLLREAAAATGTEPRRRLTVFLYASRDELHLATGTPEWASGVYDGAVHVVEEPAVDFGVRMATLRHEVMHAQLHTGVGCMPAWFNEGAAQFFAGRPPVPTWIAMLRERAGFDFDALGVPTIAEAPKGDAPLLYAQSLAMLLHVLERSDGGLQDVVQSLHELDLADPHLSARTLWRSLSPGTTASDVRASLARRMFGPLPQLELDALVAGQVCCSGERRLSELSCRALADEPPANGRDAGAPATLRCRPY